ncbi:hypothetical protein [Sphingomonas hengshuiensis]|uniref:Uncharacterized protein n=1 Tax=Sphingomonas hengshuiensis TaxID=1609977 RepID=A0A7U4LGB7_9SPHN|nr:hypothetical protein [Sphingomonas hengshuiensis]AJP73404.1 hypothetical protein TS85_18835 [Sphingomonas hengshuiensis]
MMIQRAVDTAALHRKLDTQIETAIMIAEHLGATLVTCHLQMARDMLGVPLSAVGGPNHDSTAPDPE